MNAHGGKQAGKAPTPTVRLRPASKCRPRAAGTGGGARAHDGGGQGTVAGVRAHQRIAAALDRGDRGARTFSGRAEWTSLGAPPTAGLSALAHHQCRRIALSFWSSRGDRGRFGATTPRRPTRCGPPGSPRRADRGHRSPISRTNSHVGFCHVCRRNRHRHFYRQRCAIRQTALPDGFHRRCLARTYLWLSIRAFLF
jgi:hypothetical protein